MSHFTRHGFLAALAGTTFLALTCCIVSADDADAATKPKKKRGGGRGNPAAQLINALEGIELTTAQTAKLNELGMAARKAQMELKKGAVPELRKARTAAMKKVRESGVKGKAMQEAIDKALNWNDEQKAIFAKSQAIGTKMRTAAFAVLTDAQKAKLTDKQKRIFGAAAKAKKPKKNKPAGGNKPGKKKPAANGDG